MTKGAVEAGEVVDTDEEELDGLLPGETWQFRVVFEDENLSGATGYTIQLDGELAIGEVTNGTSDMNATMNACGN